MTGQKWAKKPPGEGSRRVSGYALNPHTALPRTPGDLRGPLEGALGKLDRRTVRGNNSAPLCSPPLVPWGQIGSPHQQGAYC